MTCPDEGAAVYGILIVWIYACGMLASMLLLRAWDRAEGKTRGLTTEWQVAIFFPLAVTWGLISAAIRNAVRKRG